MGRVVENTFINPLTYYAAGCILIKIKEGRKL
jgi:hypothetical protein